MAMILEAKEIKKYYKSDQNMIKAVDGVNMTIDRGEFICIMGESGSGKTTLLNCLSTVDIPDSGELTIDGSNLTKLPPKSLNEIRKKKIGFIFQEYNLLDKLTVGENIGLVLSVNRYPLSEIAGKVQETAEIIGIADILHKYPHEISGGQKQRCACARSIIHHPAIVFADEPTGALDSKSSKVLLELLKYMNKSLDTTILMVTHDIFCASYAQKVLFLKDGRIEKELLREEADREHYKRKIYDLLEE